MEVTNEKSTCFYVHSLAADREGRLRLLAPERIEIAGNKRLRSASALSLDAAFVVALPSNSAIQRLDGCCAQKVSKAIVIGTPIKAPNRPQKNVQKNTENRTTKGEIESAFPATRGSI